MLTELSQTVAHSSRVRGHVGSVAMKTDVGQGVHHHHHGVGVASGKGQQPKATAAADGGGATAAHGVIKRACVSDRELDVLIQDTLCVVASLGRVEQASA